MSASKIKNLILLILLLGVLGLLPAVVPTQAARMGAERNVHEKLESIYASYGLKLDASSLPSSQTLYAIELENPDASNAAQALLGSKYVSEDAADGSNAEVRHSDGKGGNLNVSFENLIKPEDYQGLLDDYNRTIWEKVLFTLFPAAAKYTPQQFAEAARTMVDLNEARSSIRM